MTAKRTRTAEEPEAKGRACLIAVGGAKGGVGKSIFASNLGVYLAAKGHRTVVVDLDLGGANQHLYLGYRTLLSSTMNDFLNNRVRTLEEVTVETRYGPKLIGGNSSELGSSNVSFGRKLKMLRAIRLIDADYVILDLGGDTSYNIVDCFNLADFGIVVTTRESASYVGAYQFIKVSLYRKLQRAFGPESRFAHRRDPALERIFARATTAEGANGRSISDLIADVRAKAPQSLTLLFEILDDFRPFLVTNRMPPRFDAGPLVESLREVMRRWLAKDVVHLGSVSAQREIESSAIDLVPVVAKFPEGTLAVELGAIVGRLRAQDRRDEEFAREPLLLDVGELSEEELSAEAPSEAPSEEPSEAPSEAKSAANPPASAEQGVAVEAEEASAPAAPESTPAQARGDAGEAGARDGEASESNKVAEADKIENTFEASEQFAETAEPVKTSLAAEQAETAEASEVPELPDIVESAEAADSADAAKSAEAAEAAGTSEDREVLEARQAAEATEVGESSEVAGGEGAPAAAEAPATEAPATEALEASAGAGDEATPGASPAEGSWPELSLVPDPLAAVDVDFAPAASPSGPEPVASAAEGDALASAGAEPSHADAGGEPSPLAAGSEAGVDEGATAAVEGHEASASGGSSEESGAAADELAGASDAASASGRGSEQSPSEALSPALVDGAADAPVSADAREAAELDGGPQAEVARQEPRSPAESPPPLPPGARRSVPPPVPVDAEDAPSLTSEAASEAEASADQQGPVEGEPAQNAEFERPRPSPAKRKRARKPVKAEPPARKPVATRAKATAPHAKATAPRAKATAPRAGVAASVGAASVGAASVGAASVGAAQAAAVTAADRVVAPANPPFEGVVGDGAGGRSVAAADAAEGAVGEPSGLEASRAAGAPTPPSPAPPSPEPGAGHVAVAPTIVAALHEPLDMSRPPRPSRTSSGVVQAAARPAKVLGGGGLGAAAPGQAAVGASSALAGGPGLGAPSGPREASSSPAAQPGSAEELEWTEGLDFAELVWNGDSTTKVPTAKPHPAFPSQRR